MPAWRREIHMDTIQRRTIVGLSGLVALWVVVYWVWEPRADRDPTVTFADSAFEDRAISDTPTEVERVPIRLQTPDDANTDEDSVEPFFDDIEFGTPPFRWLVARSDDTFEKIAQREFGRKSLWTAIARANPLKDPERLKGGDRIKIPLDPDNPQGRADEPEELSLAPKVIEYTVQPNDTLSGIAQKMYGSIRFVDFLFDANRDRLKSPDDLRLGQVLIVPPKPEPTP